MPYSVVLCILQIYYKNKREGRINFMKETQIKDKLFILHNSGAVVSSSVYKLGPGTTSSSKINF